jgi:hypothetical protein
MDVVECRIGQTSRCAATGCEWRKLFGLKASTSKCTPGHPIKLNKEINPIAGEKKYRDKNADTKLFNRVGIVKQDDWIKKIKTLK